MNVIIFIILLWAGVGTILDIITAASAQHKPNYRFEIQEEPKRVSGQCQKPAPGKYLSGLRGIDKVLSMFEKGSNIVASVNQDVIEGRIISVSFDTRVLIVQDDNGEYFIPFDNIGYIRSLVSTSKRKL